MDNSDYIARKIKEGFEGVEHKAPEGLWSAINTNLESNSYIIDEKIKSSFENSSEQVPSAIWERIDKQLTIDKGWIKVYKFLQIQTFYKWSKRVAALLLLLFFIVIGLKDYFNKTAPINLSQTNSEFSQNEKQQIALKNQEKPTKTISNEEQKKSEHAPNIIDKINHIKQFKKNNLVTQAISSISQNSIQSDNDLINNLFILNDKDGESMQKTYKQNENLIIGSLKNDKSKNDLISLLLDSEEIYSKNTLTDNIYTIKQVNDSLSNLTNNNDDKNKIDSLRNNNLSNDSTTNLLANLIIVNTEENKENKQSKITKLEFGFTTAINSTAIINNTTVNAFNEESLVAFIPTFGSNIGLQIVYHFNEKHSITNSLSNSNVNQAYNQFNKGRLNEEKINISFIRLQPLYQFKYKRFENKTTALNIKAGPYLGFLTKSNSTINELPKSVYYNNYDFGVTVQIGQSVDFTKLVLDYGLNIDRGLSNLNKGTNELPAYFNRTKILGLGIYLSMRYKL